MLMMSEAVVSFKAEHETKVGSPTGSAGCRQPDQ